MDTYAGRALILLLYMYIPYAFLAILLLKRDISSIPFDRIHFMSNISNGKLISIFIIIQCPYLAYILLAYIPVMRRFMVASNYWNAFSAIYMCIIMIYIVVCITRSEGKSFISIFKIGFYDMNAVLSLYIMLSAVNILSMHLRNNNYFFTCSDPDLSMLMHGDSIDIAIILTLRILISPVLEEILFRGMLYPAIFKKTGRLIAMTLSSLLWTHIHLYTLQPSVGVFIQGMILVWLYDRRGSLMSPILLHMFKNSWILSYYVGFCS